jgi:hypothetical protein
MGTLVTSTSQADSKSGFVVTTPLAASVVVADGSLASWVGATVSTNVESYNGLGTCKEKLREAGWPNPVTAELSAAVFNTKTQVLTVTNGIAPTLTEDDVAVLQGLDYTPAGVSNSPRAQAMSELWLEIDKVA